MSTSKHTLLLCLAGLPLAAKAQDAASDKQQAATPAYDYQVVRRQEVEVNERKASAINQAPTQSRLDALQPQSTIIPGKPEKSFTYPSGHPTRGVVFSTIRAELSSLR